MPGTAKATTRSETAARRKTHAKKKQKTNETNVNDDTRIAGYSAEAANKDEPAASQSEEGSEGESEDSVKKDQSKSKDHAKAEDEGKPSKHDKSEEHRGHRKPDDDHQITEENMKHETDSKVSTASSSGEGEVVEKGHLYFFYRPKVHADEIHSLDDVQKLYMMMSPEGSVGSPVKLADGSATAMEDAASKPPPDAPPHRLAIISAKMLPDDHTPRARIWAFIEKVSSNIADISLKLGSSRYATKTKGETLLPSARLTAEARYALIKHGTHMHLVYDLEVPEHVLPPQRAFHIKKESGFLVQVRNPNNNTPSGPQEFRGLSEKQRPSFPPELQKQFAGKRKRETKFGSPDVRMLNYEHCELLFIATHKDVHEFGRIVEELENETEAELEAMHEKFGDHLERDAYNTLGVSKETNPDATARLV